VTEELGIQPARPSSPDSTGAQRQVGVQDHWQCHQSHARTLVLFGNWLLINSVVLNLFAEGSQIQTYMIHLC